MITNWIITGDCHGKVNRFDSYTYPRDGTVGIIILGDAGINYYLNKSDNKVKEKLQNSGYKFYLVRGNHEARPEDVPGVSYVYDEEVKGNVGLDEKYPAIHYFIDGYSYDIDGHPCLVIGGAYSIDKNYRLSRGYPYIWFENEQLTPEERESILKKVKGQKYDFIFTHTCPRSWEPTDLFLNSIDQDTVDKSMEDWLDEVKDAITFQVWLFGHFHADRIERFGVEQYYLYNETLSDIWNRWSDLKGWEYEMRPPYRNYSFRMESV